MTKEMAQWLRVLRALAEDLRSEFSSQDPWWVAHTACDFISSGPSV